MRGLLVVASAAALGSSDNATAVVSVAMSPHAIPDRPAFIPHNSRLCIHPPPFGTQCTMHVQDAISACLGLEGCKGLVCPDPKP